IAPGAGAFAPAGSCNTLLELVGTNWIRGVSIPPGRPSDRPGNPDTELESVPGERIHRSGRKLLRGIGPGRPRPYGKLEAGVGRKIQRRAGPLTPAPGTARNGRWTLDEHSGGQRYALLGIALRRGRDPCRLPNEGRRGAIAAVPLRPALGRRHAQRYRPERLAARPGR